MTMQQVLRALCRFDSATTEEIAQVCGGSKQTASHHLRRLAIAGHAVRLGRNYIRYSVTDAGRDAAKEGQ